MLRGPVPPSIAAAIAALVNPPIVSAVDVPSSRPANEPWNHNEARMTSNTTVEELEDRVAKLQRAVYYLIWKRTGFGEQCVHCGHSYPGHAERCKAAEVEALVR